MATKSGDGPLWGIWKAGKQETWRPPFFSCFPAFQIPLFRMIRHEALPPLLFIHPLFIIAA
jgi:hypothetical protein